ncbi:MAG: hypothetical protein EOM41_11505 [Bacilli bacterium]|nr:hypothetical protein [Bacilli bacterium]
MNVRNQVLRKHVKLHNSVNVNIPLYINVSKHSRVYLMGAFSMLFTKVYPKSCPKFTLFILNMLIGESASR